MPSTPASAKMEAAVHNIHSQFSHLLHYNSVDLRALGFILSYIPFPGWQDVVMLRSVAFSCHC
jgi:hypothetical protein